jgi:hypothetical protein
MAVASQTGNTAPGATPQESTVDQPAQSESIAGEALREGYALRQRFDDRQAIVRTVRLVGGAMITILLVALVLNEIFNAIAVGSGPFSGIATDLQSTGVAAMGLLIVGLIIVAANRLMNIFGGGGGM